MAWLVGGTSSGVVAPPTGSPADVDRRTLEHHRSIPYVYSERKAQVLLLIIALTRTWQESAEIDNALRAIHHRFALQVMCSFKRI